LQNYAGRPLKGTFGTHYSEPISLYRLKVTLSGWPPLTVLLADCLTATDITSLKTCLAYYRLVPLVGAVGHVSQTVTVDHPRYGAVSRPLKLYVNTPFARRSIFFVERHIVLDYRVDAELVHFCLMCMMVLLRNIDPSTYHPVVLEGHGRNFIVCTFFVCTRGVHMLCTDVSVNKYYCTYVVMYVWTYNNWVCFSLILTYATCSMFLHSYSCCFYMWVVYTCVHHKQAHHISLYKYYNNICCDIVSKHVSVIQVDHDHMWLIGKLINKCQTCV
jgi:hypothetical protein